MPLKREENPRKYPKMLPPNSMYELSDSPTDTYTSRRNSLQLKVKLPKRININKATPGYVIIKLL